MVEIHEIIKDNRKYYADVIKPMIEEGRYEEASFELRNQLFILQDFRGKVIFDVHCGISYVASMEGLIMALKTTTERPNKTIEMFEAYAAQTSLPMRKD